jgi:hypothetical protein
MIFGEENESPMDPNPHNPQQPQKIHLDVAHMETVYANFFALAGSPDELVVYLGTNSPLPNMPQPTARVSHRLMLLPANGKRLMVALQQAVKAHEDRFGPIELPPQRRPDNPGH